MTITVDIPDSALLAGTDSRYLKEALVAMLYQAGKLSGKEACDVLGIARREFEDLLSRFGVSILSDDAENMVPEQRIARLHKLIDSLPEAPAIPLEATRREAIYK